MDWTKTSSKQNLVYRPLVLLTPDLYLSFTFFFKINLFILLSAVLGLCCCARALSSCSKRGSTPHCSVQASQCSGFSCCGALALGARASAIGARALSSCGSWGLEHRLSGCGARAQLLHGTWDLPRPGIEPVSPALAGGFLTTAPPEKSPSHFLFFNLFILFIYFWLHCVFVAAHRLSLVSVSGGYSLLWCAGFSLRWFLLLRSTGSRHVGFSSCGLRALERRLSSCGARVQLLPGMWDLPRPGLEPMSPALAGGFLTTAPPGKSSHLLLLNTSNLQKSVENNITTIYLSH